MERCDALPSHSGPFKKNTVTFDDKFAADLTAIAERMLDAGVSHTEQNFQEIRLTPKEIDVSLQRFRSYIR